MPIVPRYDRPQVQEQGFSNVQTSVPNNINQAGSGAQISQAINEGVRLFQEEKRKADDVATTDAYARLSTLKNNLEYDPNTGARTKRGQDAFGVIDDYSEKFDQGAEEIESNLKNEDQKAMFRQMRAKERLSLTKSLQGHVYNETIRFDNEATQSAITASLNDSVNNYKNQGSIQENIARQTALVDAYSERNGLSADGRKNMLLESHSQTYRSVLERMMTNGEDLLAKEYYSKIKGKMTAKDTIQVEKALEVSSVRGESQRKTDEIMLSSDTVTDGLAKARQIKDPELRDAVVSRVKSRFSELKAIEKQELDTLYLDAYQRLESNPNADPVDVIPPSVFSKLNAQQKTALYKVNDPGTDDVNTWDAFLNLTAQQMSSLSLSDFQTQYWAGMDVSHREKAADLWNTARNDMSDLKVDGFLTERNVIKNALINSDFYSVDKPSFEEKQTLVNFESQIDKQYQEFQRTKGRKPYPEEFQKMVDDELTKKVFVDDWFFDSQKLAADVKENERGDVYVPIKEIPEDALIQINNMAKEAGITLTKGKIEKIYGAAVLGDDKRVQELLR